MKKILRRTGLTITDVLDIAAPLLEGGRTKKEAARQIANMLDDLVDFSELVKGIGGDILEAIDQPLFQAVVLAILKTKAPAQ